MKEFSLNRKKNIIEYDRTITWVNRFIKNANSQPDHNAVIDSCGSYTYSELDRISNKIACYLLKQGIKPDDYVAVKMRRIKEFAAVILGIHKAGAAYVPIDPDYPKNRIDYMISNSDSKIVIDEDMIEKILSSRIKASPVNNSRVDGQASLIYTSGSTGTPKGVMLRHSALNASIAWNIYLFGLDSSKKNIHFPSFSFALSSHDFFGPLVAGGEVHILNDEIRKDIMGIYNYINSNRITGMSISTSIGMALLNKLEVNMDYIMLAGERLLPIKRFTKTKIFNGYGSTEFGACNLYHVVDEKDAEEKSVPIGKSMPGIEAFVCDNDFNLVPQGEIGQLCLCGEQMSDGYLKLDESTSDSFIDCPFIPGKKMYCTGDLVRCNEDGTMKYIGRNDSQVKLRGFRIELGEVEATAASFEGIIRTCAKIVNSKLVLYYSADRRIDKDEFKNHISQVLADYMVPAVFMQLDTMPLTPNGKIKRDALPVPKTISENIEGPKNDDEEFMLEVAKKYVPDAEFGVTDDLMLMGMDSLKLMTYVQEINEKLPKVTLADIMHHRSIRSTLNCRRRMIWFYDTYDVKKPTMVFIHGIVPISVTMPKFKVWNKHFNILVFEPLEEHYNILFRAGGFDEVVGLYSLLLSIYIPDDAKVAVFMGYCYGGTIAAYLAKRWQKDHGTMPGVVLGDSFFVLGKKGTDNVLDVMDMSLKSGKHTSSVEVVKHKFKVLAELEKQKTALGKYEGKGIFISAGKYQGKMFEDMKEQTVLENEKFIKKYLPNIQIVTFEDSDHDDLYNDQALIDEYLKMLLELADWKI